MFRTGKSRFPSGVTTKGVTFPKATALLAGADEDSELC